MAKHIQGVIAAVVMVASGIGLAAQQGQRGGGPPQAPQTPQAAAPIDLTGNWVSVVTEDWRWRMVTPPKGDFASVPLNPEGQKVGNSWDPATDGSCLAYGAAGLMRNPTRVRISWENDRTIKIETDAGVQTRRLVFGASQPPAQRSLQGYSVAEWEIAAAGRGAPAGPRRGNLKATTTMMSAGWLRKNGVPYSEDATMTEYSRSLRLAQWRRVVFRDHRRVRCEVPESGLCHQHPLQEGSRRLEVGTQAM